MAEVVTSEYNNSLSLPRTGSTTAEQLLAKAVPARASDSERVVWRVSHGTVRDPAIQARMSALLSDVAKMPLVPTIGRRIWC